MIMHIIVPETKTKILPTCLQGNYREFSDTSYGVLWAERVEVVYCKQEGVCVL